MWSIFLKRCQSFEMCCEILSTGWSQVSVQLLEEAQGVWVRFRLGLCCSTSAGSAGMSSAHCLQSQLKIIHLHTPTWGFFCPISLSSLLFMCGGVCLQNLKWLNYFKVWAWTVGLCCYLPTKTLSLSRFLTQQGLLSWLPLLSCCEPVNSECCVWDLDLHFQLWALEVLWGWWLGGISWCCVWALSAWGGQWVTGGGLSSCLAATVTAMILPQSLLYHLCLCSFLR